MTGTEDAIEARMVRVAPRASRRWALQARLAPYLFVAPFVVLFCVFMLWPMVNSMWMSTWKYANPRTNQYVGAGNYKYILTDKVFWYAVGNTVMFTILIVGLQVPASLGLAMLLNSKRVKFRGLFRFAFFSSHLVGHVFVAVIFRLILRPRTGLMAGALGSIYAPWAEINWTENPVFGRLAIVLAVFWINIGWGMIYFLAALQSVDRELYEAAEVDGAGRWARFRNVTLPSIKPVVVFMVVVCTIGCFQIFELPYMLFDNGTGPGMAGMTVVMYLYMMGFEGVGDIGAASAVGWILACLIFGVAMVQVRIARGKDDG